LEYNLRTVLVSHNPLKNTGPRAGNIHNQLRYKVQICVGWLAKRGARLEEIGQIGLKPALERLQLLISSHIMKTKNPLQFRQLNAH